MGVSYRDYEATPAHFVDWALAYADVESNVERQRIAEITNNSRGR